MNDLTLCKECGGVIGVTYRGAIISFDMAQHVNAEVYHPPITIRDTRTTEYRLCLGHPAPKHDGMLDKRDPRNYYHASVEVQTNWSACDGSQVVVVSGGYGDCESNQVLIDPAQALSLLVWLQEQQ